MNTETIVKEEEIEMTTTEKKGMFNKASEGLVEFAQNRPVVTAFVAMGTYDIGKQLLVGPVKSGAKFVAGKVGQVFGRKAAQAAVGTAGEQVAHLVGSAITSIF